MNEEALKAQIQVLTAQRNQAMDNVVALYGENFTLKAELEATAERNKVTKIDKKA